MTQKAASSGAVTGLYAIMDADLVAPGRMEETAARVITGGVTLLQLRSKNAGSGKTLEAARALRRLTAQNGVLFIVNDRADIALISGADGVHLGQDDMALKDARRLLGEDAIIGASTHTLEEALHAQEAGADYISFGPVFRTSTKKDALSPRGLEALKKTVEGVKRPVVAIGGITEENLDGVLEAGAASVAMISAILLSRDITAKTSSIVSKIKEARLKRVG